MTLRINGLTDTEMGFAGIESLQSWLDGPRVVRGSTLLPGFTGAVASSQQAVQEREISFTAIINNVTVSARDAVVDDVGDRLRGLLEVTFDDQPTKRVICRLTSHTNQGFQPGVSFGVGDLRVGVVLTAYQAIKVSTLPRIIALPANTPRIVRVGTAATVGRIWIQGSSTNPVINLTDWRGVLVESMTVTGSRTASQSWMLDLIGETFNEVTNVTTFVRANDDIAPTVGFNGFFVIKPEYADRLNSVWPRLELTSGTGWLEYWELWRS